MIAMESVLYIKVLKIARILLARLHHQRQEAVAIENRARVIDQQRAKKQQVYIQRTLNKELAKLPANIRSAARQARATPANKRTSAQKDLIRKYPSINVSAGSLYLYDSQAAADLKKIAAQAKKLRDTKPHKTSWEKKIIN